MTSREITKAIKTELSAKYGTSFNEDTFKKAIAKAQRWCKAAYGSSSLVTKYEEDGDVPTSFVDCYYEETANDTTNGVDTFNRSTFNK